MQAISVRTKSSLFISTPICPRTHPVSHPFLFRNPEVLTSLQRRCFQEVDANQHCFLPDISESSGFIFQGEFNFAVLTFLLSRLACTGSTPTLVLQTKAVTTKTRNSGSPFLAGDAWLGWNCNCIRRMPGYQAVPDNPQEVQWYS